MALRHVKLEHIDQNALQRLIDTGAAEWRDIDYKQQTYGGNDDARTQFLADISSFANAVGGDLIIGMTEAAGVPTGFMPFMGDTDQEQLRLENMARDGLEPRIENLQTKAIPLQAGGAAIIVRVPRSYNPPHRVTFKGKHRFWARSSAGKYEPDVDELRTLFTQAPQLAERIRSFRIDRIAHIAAGDAPVPLMGNCCLVLHVVPFSAFDFGLSVSLPIIKTSPHLFPPLYSSVPSHWRITFDGFLALSNADQSQKEQRAYVQLFRSGALEAVTSTIEGGTGFIEALWVDGAIVGYTRRYVAAMHECGIEPPYAVLVSLLGTSDKKLRLGNANWLHTDPPTTLNRDQYHFSEVILETLPLDDKSCGVALRAILDQLANTAGYATAQSFDGAGNYVLQI